MGWASKREVAHRTTAHQLRECEDLADGQHRALNRPELTDLLYVVHLLIVAGCVSRELR
jgi:hypothetical protein